MKFPFNFNNAEKSENVALVAELTEQELATVTGGCGDKCGDDYDPEDCDEPSYHECCCEYECHCHCHSYRPRCYVVCCY